MPACFKRPAYTFNRRRTSRISIKVHTYIKIQSSVVSFFCFFFSGHGRLVFLSGILNHNQKSRLITCKVPFFFLLCASAALDAVAMCWVVGDGTYA